MRSLAAGLALLLLAVPAHGASDREAFEARLDSTLRARSPVADSLFRLANQAAADNDHRRAVELYVMVSTLVPDFGTAVRRQAYEELQLGNRAHANTLLDSLIRRDPDPWNLVAKAGALVDAPEGMRVPAEIAGEARGLLERARPQLPDASFLWQVTWQVGLAAEDPVYTRHAAEQLVRLEPRAWTSWYSLAVASLIGDQLRDADMAFTRARQLGMPDEARSGLAQAMAAAHGRHTQAAWFWGFLWALVGWVVAFAVLSFVGLTLSRETLRQAGDTVADRTGQATGGNATLRSVYKGVLWLCCAFYYVSIPLVLVVVLALGAGLTYLAFALGHVPIKLVLIILFVCLVSAWSIVRSLVVGGRDEDPGEPLDLAHHPLLRQLLDRVAGRIGTRAVDDVFLTPGTEIAVMERGGVRGQLSGRARRCLILGIGVLDGMTVGQLKAILAHEYGHFSNRDTAGGGVALTVRRSVMTMTIHLVRGGAAGWYNPAWWFVRGFYALFLRISQGASRLQEILADRWAAFAYGSAAFAAGLTHVIGASVRFDVHANAAVREAIGGAHPLPNLYRYRSTAASDTVQIEQQIYEAMRAEPTPYDSHPAPAQRLAWVGALDAPGESEPEDGDEAWTLLTDREELEKHMTKQIRDTVTAEHGVQFKEEADTSEAKPAPAGESS